MSTENSTLFGHSNVVLHAGTSSSEIFTACICRVAVLRQ